ncbi:hypothetical protein RHS03_02170, partial [Rhizoctonia solani]
MTTLPLGKLSNNKWEHPRERELRELKELCEEMRREAEEAEERMLQSKKDFDHFIQVIEATYGDDQIGLAFFRSQCSNELFELQEKLEEERKAYDEDIVRLAEQKEKLRREIRAYDKKIEAAKKAEAIEERKKAVANLDSIMGSNINADDMSEAMEAKIQEVIDILPEFSEKVVLTYDSLKAMGDRTNGNELHKARESEPHEIEPHESEPHENESIKPQEVQPEIQPCDACGPSDSGPHQSELPGQSQQARSIKRNSKRTRSKNRNLEPAKPAKAIKVQILIGHAEFLEELSAAAVEDYLSQEEFIPHLFGHQRDDRAARVTLGLKILVNGLEGFTPDILNTCMSKVDEASVINSINGQFTNTLRTLNNRALHGIYNSIEDKHGAFNIQTRASYVQSCGAALQGLRFGIYWRSLENSSTPKAQKGLAILEAYLESRNIQLNTNTKAGKEAVQELKKSLDFIAYKSAFNNFKRGAVRFLEGYKVLGPVILVCPLLDFSSFKDPVIGARINGILPEIKKMQNPQRVKEQEEIQSKLVAAIFQKLPTSKAFMNTLEDIKSNEN